MPNTPGPPGSGASTSARAWRTAGPRRNRGARAGFSSYRSASAGTKRRGTAMYSPKATSPAAAIACCLTLLAAPALAQSGANTEPPRRHPGARRGAGCGAAGPPAARRRRGGADPRLARPQRQPGRDAPQHLCRSRPHGGGQADDPLPWGSVVGAVPGMNAGPAYRPLAPGDIVDTGPPWRPASRSPGCPKARCPARCRGCRRGRGRGRSLRPADGPPVQFVCLAWGAGEADHRRAVAAGCSGSSACPASGMMVKATRSPSASRS